MDSDGSLLNHESARPGTRISENNIIASDSRGSRPRRYHNLARNVHESQHNGQWHLTNPTHCPYCQALLFHGETSQLCCRNERTKLDLIQSPIELQELYAENNEQSRHFMQHIRSYNHVFSFTSMRVIIDESLAISANGIYKFRAHGSIYHSIGSFLPTENSRPRYMQMWIVDTDHEIENRLEENQGLRRELLTKIQNILDLYNPFVHVFRQIGIREEIPSCKLIIKEQQPNQRQYSLPTTSQVAAVIVDNECSYNLSSRDIIIQGIGGHLMNIQDIVGYYDPLQYPLLLSYGNVGHRIVLPSTFIGSPRDMYQRYQDAMTLVQTYEKPDLMLTMTCNPNWHEIKDQLIPGQSPQDHPDLITRIFKLKFEEFKIDVVDRGVLGRVRSYTYVIEYQKRRLPHVHMLVIFDNIDKRREGTRVVSNNNDQVIIDNGWVVSYNPWLLLKYDCHINVEVCDGIKCVKYIYKYIHKGPDRVALELHNRQNCDEIQQYVDGSWICAPEALWRIYSFEFSRMYPSVIWLQIHLPNEQLINFNPEQSLGDILADADNLKTMLTEFFIMNSNHVMVDNQNKVVGRIYVVSPSEGERFYLRKLLNHVKEPSYFEELRKVNGITYTTFKGAAEMRGLLEKDYYIHHCLQKAYYGRTISGSSLFITNKLLLEIRRLLHQYKKKLDDFDLPSISTDFLGDFPLPRITKDELSIEIPEEDLRSIGHLNLHQKMAFDVVMESIVHNQSNIFFIDGPGGTGKTFLYRSILAHLRKNGKISIAVATSGITATLLPGGRTAHSRLQIPLRPTISTLCKINKQSDLAELIKRATTVV
ncbi:uncharacterized protein [Henckelia pumila]|uniref:uncharacterized protein n=1 Tax=Henckelia pumila TaxID=405737 RepID=UPI003C6DF887